MAKYKYDFNEVKEVADVETVLDHYDLASTLKTRGDERVGRCMLGKGSHGKKDSFTFNVKKKTFQCFSCKKRGSVIDFVRFHDALTLPESAERVMQIMGAADDEDKGDSHDEGEEQETQSTAAVYKTPYKADDQRSQDAVLEEARSIMRSRINTNPVMDSPEKASEVFIHDLGGEEREIFSVLYLDTKFRTICYERMFYGTLNETDIYVREIAKNALLVNAFAVICGHNHPAGTLSPSSHDIAITKKIKDALGILSIKINDHIIVARDQFSSMATTHGDLFF